MPDLSERVVRPCSDGVTRHTVAIALDCPICHPECHTICGCGS